MWYVIQVRTGTEESIRIQCEKLIPRETLSRCFIVYYEAKRSVRGSWRILKKTLFPGYLFLVADDAAELKMALHRVIGLTKLLTTGDDIIPLSDDEIRLIRRLAGENELVELSIGVIEGEEVRVVSGPLAGMEGYIKRIDRHKRKAWLDITMFGRKQEIQVGLEVVEKRQERGSQPESP